MIRRRRRRNREIAFGLDSFLDVITNVIGIIIRMIIVVWVGARSYHEMQHRPKTIASPSSFVVEKKLDDPLAREIAKHRQYLQLAQQTLLQHLQQLPPLAQKRGHVQKQLTETATEKSRLFQQRQQLTLASANERQQFEQAKASLADLEMRGKQLRDAISRLPLSPAGKNIYYRTPLSRPVDAEELIFECQGGKVSFVDLGAFTEEMKDSLRRNAESLQQSNTVEGVTKQRGPFRVRYRFRIPNNYLSGLVGGEGIDAFWEVEPLAVERGESAEQALDPRSKFRQIVDFADPRHAVVTFCVYPDSFALYRQLRDYLYERDMEVAARPLPIGQPIAGSPHGSASLGQ